MNAVPVRLDIWQRRLDRLPYLLAGVGLFAVKFFLDWAAANRLFNRSWSPWNYLIWPDERTLRVSDLPADDRTFVLTMLLLSAPFILAGVVLTVQRLRSAGLPIGLVVLFFVPLVNLLFFLVLVLLPSRPPVVSPPPPEPPPLDQLRQAHRQVAGDPTMKHALIAIIISVPLTAGLVVLGAQVLESYGFGLFVGSPFLLGMVSVLLFGFSRAQSYGACMAVALVAATLVGFLILLIALEGAICLLMAAPIAYGLAFAGGVVGYMIQSRPWLNQESPWLIGGLLLLLPGLMAAESASEPEPTERAVVSVVEVAAPPESVWDLVLAFPPLSEPDDWLFRAGVAYPLCAEIYGQGVGAVRHCIFSTGTFVEPIDVWQAPTLLRFRVTEQPEPMREWSPYTIHPPHLDHYLVSRQGQFRLEALADGRTRLEGTTWYTNRMWPAPYWGLWSDHIIHRIHLRVLNHIRTVAEAK